VAGPAPPGVVTLALPPRGHISPHLGNRNLRKTVTAPRDPPQYLRLEWHPAANPSWVTHYDVRHVLGVFTSAPAPGG
jgi:hypothetical protein